MRIVAGRCCGAAPDAMQHEMLRCWSGAFRRNALRYNRPRTSTASLRVPSAWNAVHPGQRELPKVVRLICISLLSFVLTTTANAQSVRKVTLSAGAKAFLSETVGVPGLGTDWQADAYLSSLDLDGDGTREHLVQLVSPRTCSQGHAVCAWVVYAGPPGRRALLATAAHTARALDTRTNGWRDIAFESREADGVVAETWAHDGTAYVRVASDVVLEGARKRALDDD